MKKAYVFCFLLVAGVGLQAMGPVEEKLSEPAWRVYENELAEKYKIYLEEKLNKSLEKGFIEEGDDATLDFCKLAGKGEYFALREDKAKETMKTACDKDGNTMTHLLVMHKMDDELEFCLENDVISFQKNKAGATALDIAFTQFFSCIEKSEKDEIDETISGDDTKNSKDLYLRLVNYIQHKESPDGSEENSDHIKVMQDKDEALPHWRIYENQLAEKYKILLTKNLNEEIGDNEDIELGWKHIVAGADCFGLSDDKIIEEVIKTACDKNGNTITHLLVTHTKNTELVEFAKKGVVSLQKNEQGKTALDLAYAQFRNCIEKKEMQGDAKNLKCLYLVLSNYMKIQEHPDYIKEIQQKYNKYGETKTIWCCDLHSK